MRSPEGSFARSMPTRRAWRANTTLVADELREFSGDADAAIAHFEATARGNFEGSNILTARGPVLDDGVRERVRMTLRQAREQRVRPGLDDKRLCSWNALMISALAETGAVLARPDYVDAAVAAAEFLWDTLHADGPACCTFFSGWLDDSRGSPSDEAMLIARSDVRHALVRRARAHRRV